MYLANFLANFFNSFLYKIRSNIPLSDDQLDKYLTIIGIFTFLFISFLLNFIVEVFSNLELTDLDISNKKNMINPKRRKLVFIFINNKLLSSFVDFLQIIINYFISFLSIKINFLKFDNFSKKIVIFINLIISIVIAFFIDIFPKYFSEKYAEIFLDNWLFISFSFFLLRIPIYFFPKLMKVKIHSGGIKAVSNLTNNLHFFKLINEEDAIAINSALDFKKKKLNSSLIKKMIYFDYKMSYEEIYDIHCEYSLYIYPVFNNDYFSGILNMKKFQNLYNKKLKIDNIIIDWRREIEIGDFFIRNKNEYINVVDAKMRELNYGFMFIIKNFKNIEWNDIKKSNFQKLKKSHFYGIITIDDIKDVIYVKKNKK